MKNKFILIFLLCFGFKIYSMEEAKVEFEKTAIESLDGFFACILHILMNKDSSEKDKENSKQLLESFLATNFDKLSSTVKRLLLNQDEAIKILKDHYESLKKHCSESLPSVPQDCVNIIADYSSPSDDFIDLHNDQKMIQILKKKIKQKESFNEYTSSENCFGAIILGQVISHAIESDDYYLLEELIKSGADVNSSMDQDNFNSLLHAVNQKSLKMIEFLLSHGADPNCMYRKEYPLIHLAIYMHNKSYILDLLKLFIRYKVNLNIQNILDDKLHHTLLMRCADEGYFDCVKLLVESGADVDIKDRNGNKASFYADENEDYEIRDYLRAREKQEVID